MREEGIVVPEGYNAKTKLVPEWPAIEEQIQEDLRQIEEEVRRRLRAENPDEKTRDHGTGSALGGGLDWAKIRKVYDEMVADCGGGVPQSAIKELKEKLRGFVVAPVDKYAQEMAIM